MSVPAIKLALKGISYGADKIPDKFWESIPGGYYKAKEQQQQQQQQQQQRQRSTRSRKHSDAGRRHRGHDQDYYDRDYYYSDDDYAPRQGSSRRRWSSVDGRGSQRRHVAQEETYYPRDSERNGWNDRNEYVERDPGYSYVLAQDNSQYKPYNPADYARPSIPAEPPADTSRGMADPSDYYRQDSKAETQYAPPAQDSYYYDNTGTNPVEVRQQTAYAPQAREGYAPPQAEYTQVTRYDAGYVPHADAGAYYAGAQRPSQLYRRESRSQPASRSGSRARSRGRRRRSADDSRSPSRRRSKSRGLKERFKHMDDDDRKLAATLGGAAGAGMLVNGLTHNTFGTLLGATLGGLAARGIEKKESEKRAASRPRRDSKVKDDDSYGSYDDYSDRDRRSHPDGRRRSRRDSF